MNNDEMALELMSYIPLFMRGPAKKAHDLSHGEMAMLRYLHDVEEVSAPTKLSKELGLSTARIASTLNSLEKKNYIQRTHDPKDRRRVEVCITDEGHTYAEERRQEALRNTKMLLEALGDDDSKEFVRIMGRIHEYSIENFERNKECRGGKEN